MNRWHVYEYLKQVFMRCGEMPAPQEIASQFSNIDPEELAEGIAEFHSMIERPVIDHNTEIGETWVDHEN